MKRRKVWGGWFAAALLLMSGLLASCGNGNALLGKWVDVKGPDSYGRPASSYEFLSDGTVIEDGNNAYTYAFLDNDRVKIDRGMGYSGDIYIYTHKVSGNTLTMTRESGSGMQTSQFKKTS